MNKFVTLISVLLITTLGYAFTVCNRPNVESTLDCKEQLLAELDNLEDKKAAARKICEEQQENKVNRDFDKRIFDPIIETKIVLDQSSPDIKAIHQSELTKITKDGNALFETYKQEYSELCQLIGPMIPKGRNCQDSLRTIKKMTRELSERLTSFDELIEEFQLIVNEVSEKQNEISGVSSTSPSSKSPPVAATTIKAPLPGVNGFHEIDYINQPGCINYYVANQRKEDIFVMSYDNSDDGERQPLYSIKRVRNVMEDADFTVKLIMNAGMYNRDLTPKGLFVAGGNTYEDLDLSSGNPNVFQNFYLLPNGVYAIDKNGASHVLSTDKYAELERRLRVKYATQSGPMLLIDGNIHSGFNANSKNRNIRNGVGILPDGNAVFAISNCRVTFYEFATFFQSLGCENALYLDGVVSKMYVPEHRNEGGEGLGVFLVVTGKRG